MAEATGMTGIGTTLTGSTTGVIGLIRKCDISGRKCDSIDVSTCASVSQVREFVPGMIDEGEMSAEVVYDGSNGGVAQSLDTAYKARRVETWTLAYPDGSSSACTGFITGLSIPLSFDKEVTQSLTIKLTGSMTYTPAAA